MTPARLEAAEARLRSLRSATRLTAQPQRESDRPLSGKPTKSETSSIRYWDSATHPVTLIAGDVVKDYVSLDVIKPEVKSGAARAEPKSIADTAAAGALSAQVQQQLKVKRESSELKYRLVDGVLTGYYEKFSADLLFVPGCIPRVLPGTDCSDGKKRNDMAIPERKARAAWEVCTLPFLLRVSVLSLRHPQLS